MTNEELIAKLRNKTVKKLPNNWKDGRKCPDCGSDANRPKCFFDYGPSCARHDPDAYDPPAWEEVPDPLSSAAADRIEALVKVGVKPAWLTNCTVCGRVVDTRESSEGGDAHGCEYAAGWVCSRDCAEKLSPDPEFPTTPPSPYVATLVQALENIADAFGCECGDVARAALRNIKGDVK